MKLYVIFTVESDESGMTTITWKKELHLFKEKAFEKAKQIGINACVVELTQTNVWNLEQIKAEEF